MIAFYKIGYLWLLLLLPLLAVLLWLLNRMALHRRARFADTALWKILMPQHRILGGRVRLFATLAVLFLGIVALAEPRIGTTVDKGQKATLDIIVAVDVSNSMLATDMYPSRLEALKTGLFALLQKLRGDRIGLVAFAGNAYPQMPLTSDYGTARMFIESIGPQKVSMQGTNLTRAISASLAMFGKEEADNRTIFLLTDGENHEDSALVEAQRAREAGVLLNVASFGTTQGAPIPVYENGVQVGFKTDRRGNQVVSRANPDMLRKLAEAGGGYFVQADDAVSALLNLYKQTDDMPRLPMESTDVRNNANRFLWLLWPAFFLLLLERAIRNRWFARVHKAVPVLALLALGAGSAFAQHPNAVLRQGVTAYKEGNFDLAIQKFKEAGKEKELKTIAGYNLGAAYYKKGMLDSAINVVQRVAVEDDDPKLQQMAWYNLGNAFLQQDKTGKAIDAYTKALKLDPNDENARYNLAYALKKQQAEQQKQKEKEQKEDEKQDQNNAKKEEKPLDKNDANQEVLKLLEEAEKQKRKDYSVDDPIKPEKDW
ncbi:MAG: VWA domain-containing protein [Flavobacteriales bacterium]